MSPYRRRVPYIPDRSVYKLHYNSAGGGLPVFRGVYQDGSGLLSNIFRSALPILKSAGKTLLKSGARALTDVVEGKDIKTAIKHRGVEGLKTVGRDMLGRAETALRQTGGRRRVSTTLVRPGRKRSVQSITKKACSDIFDERNSIDIKKRRL